MKSTKVGEMMRLEGFAPGSFYFEGRTSLNGLSFFTANRSSSKQSHLFRRFLVSSKGRGKEIGWLHEAGLDADGNQLLHLILNPGSGAVFLVAVEIQPSLFALHRDPADQEHLAAYGEDAA
ncbi:MAG: hypothetical protein GC186_16455 [Rhodobacteraceae bacterium]|nr:hypothetical protein [Paracoccaceae bacterium]